MKINGKRAVLVAFLIVGAVLAVGAATGAVAYDEETSNTTTVSDVNSTSTYVRYSENGTVYLEAQVESDDPAFELIDVDANETIEYLSDGDLNQGYSDTATSPNAYHYSGNVSHSEFSTLELDPNENKTIKFKIINNESKSNPTTSHVNVTLQNSKHRTYVVLEDSEVGDGEIAELPDESTFGYTLPWNSEAATYEEEVSINGDNTSVTIDVENSTVAERLSESAEGMDSDEWVISTLATVDDEPVKMYLDDAPSDADGTYMVYDSSTDEITIELGSSHDDSDNVDIYFDANRGWSDQIGLYGIDALRLPF